MRNKKPVGIILMAFGGIDSLEAVEPFMTNIMGGRKPPAALVTRMVERYRLIGGKSPLPETIQAQAEAVEQLLIAQGWNCVVRAGTLHWNPFIRDTLKAMAACGIEQVVGISLSPFNSRVTSGAYQEALTKANEALDHPLQILTTRDWNANPIYIQALITQVQQALGDTADELCDGQNEQQQLQVIFSAHSLPVAHIANGDTYELQLKATLQAILDETGPLEHYLAYQSKGGGQGEWLGPEVEEVLDKLADQGKLRVLLVPFGFTCDHIETLYDIDIAIADHARAKGINLTRIRALNCDQGFIRALANVATEVLEKEVV